MEETNKAANNQKEETGIRRVRLTSMRKTISKRLVESLHSIAQSSSSYEIDATNLLELREKFIAQEESLRVRVTVTDLFALALTKALMQCPAMNAFMTDTEMIYHDYVNLGVAVALPGGLVTIVIRDADKMKVEELSVAIKKMVEKANNKKLTIEDITDATFTMSSTGPKSTGGVAIPLVMTPQAGIVQFGAAIRKPVVIDEEIVIRSMITINMSYDHRIIDGAGVRDFNQCLKQYLENPTMILT